MARIASVVAVFHGIDDVFHGIDDGVAIMWL